MRPSPRPTRRRAKQVKYNEEHGITPVSIHKAIRDITDQLSSDAKEKAMARANRRVEYRTKHDKASQSELQKIIAEMEKQMKEAARNLEFEKAAALRDEMYELKSILADEADFKALGAYQIARRRGIGAYLHAQRFRDPKRGTAHGVVDIADSRRTHLSEAHAMACCYPDPDCCIRRCPVSCWGPSPTVMDPKPPHETHCRPFP